MTARRFELHRDTDVTGVSGTGVVVDDARFVREFSEKEYADDGRPPGATIRVTAITDQGALI